MKVAILTGSVYGSADEVARHAQGMLHAAGHQTLQSSRLTLEELLDYAPQALLAVTSTTGVGDLPDNLQPLFHQLRDVLPTVLRGVPGGIIGLGDASYGDSYCGGGEQMRELFAELGVDELQEMLRLDASETVTPETDAEPWIEQFIARLGA